MVGALDLNGIGLKINTGQSGIIYTIRRERDMVRQKSMSVHRRHSLEVVCWKNGKSRSK